MLKKHYLMTPGPTPVPEKIAKTMSEPIIHHRTPQYRDYAKNVNDNLRRLFKTKNNVLTFASSGTGAMQASVINTLSKGDTAIVVRGGKFGERFGEICEAYGIKVVPVDVEWGHAPDPGRIEKALTEHREAKAVFMQLCETSTATVYGVEAISRVAGETHAILVVDAISGLGSDEFKMDEWGVDVAIGGSQKAFMIPPGLAFCAVSKKAWGLVKESNLPKYYFDFKRYEKLVEKSDSPWTPAITLVIGLEKALSMIMEEGVDKFIARHSADAEFTRKAVSRMGLKLFSQSPSNAVTAVKVPEGLDGTSLIKTLKSRGVTFAGGQAGLKGKIIRIAHMGGIVKSDLEHALGKLEEALKEVSNVR
jgi:aspartate aminotransferase-like enzyme